MRVLVTGCAGVLGRAVSRELHLRGADRVTLAGDVNDRASADAAMSGLGPDSVVLHLEWQAPFGRAAASVDYVLAAMRAHDVGRLVYASSVAAADQDHRQKLAEAAIRDSGLEAMLVQMAPVVGRGVRSAVTDQFAGPAVLCPADQPNPLRQFVHHDDATRFLSDLVTSPATGVVTLAAEGALPLNRVAALLGKRLVRLPRAAIARLASETLTPWPIADTTRLREDFGFRCAWSNEDSVVDTRRSLITYVHLGPRNVARRSVLPLTEPGWRPDLSPWPGHQLRAIGPAEFRGEFDDEIDPQMGTFTATNVGEAMGGPMTPLSLQISLLSLRAGSEVAGRLVGLDGLLAHETQARSMCSFAHGVYINVSIIRGVYERMPGSTPEQADAQYLGVPLPEGTDQGGLSWADAKAVGTILRKGGLALARLGLSEKWLLDEAERLSHTEAGLGTLTDPELDARISLLIDTFVDSQEINAGAQMVGAATLSAAERAGASGDLTAGSLASARALEGVQKVAALVRANPAARAALEKHRGDQDPMRGFAADCPELHGAISDLLAAVGHRGPGEFELANEMFADRPSLLIDSIYQASSAQRSPAPASPQHAHRSMLERAAGSALQRRERIRDASIRIYHQLRLALREKGQRLAAAGILPDRDAVFYLSIDEWAHPPADAAERVARRRAEREKLEGIETPAMIEGDWEPVTVVAAADSTRLTGAGVSGGVVRGLVRVLTDPDDGLEPDEILVCRVTDIGWTPLFAAAAAVVSEIGGTMSHTAIVAREFEIPAVVGVEMATRRLQTGQLVEVDGTAGTVIVLPGQGNPPILLS